MIKIMYLYPNLLNIYGAAGDIDVLKAYMDACEEAFQIDRYEAGEIDSHFDFSGYDLIYIGAGTEDRVLIALGDMIRFKKCFLEYVDNGGKVLMVGASSMMGYETVVDNQDTPFRKDIREYNGLGIVKGVATITQRKDYSDIIGNCELSFCVSDTEQESPSEADPASQEHGNKISNSLVRKFDCELLGAVNSSFSVKGFGPSTGRYVEPFLRLKYDSNSYYRKSSNENNPLGTEGYVYKNCIGTEVFGPIFARNPEFLIAYCTNMLGTGNIITRPEWLDEAYLGYAHAAGLMTESK